MEDAPTSATNDRPVLIRALVGMIVGGTLGAAALVATIETQVVLLRKHAEELSTGVPPFDLEPFATVPRTQYDEFVSFLALPIILGALAGVAYRASRLWKTVSVLLLLAFPALVAGFGYDKLENEYKPSVPDFAEAHRQIREMMERNHR